MQVKLVRINLHYHLQHHITMQSLNPEDGTVWEFYKQILFVCELYFISGGFDANPFNQNWAQVSVNQREN